MRVPVRWRDFDALGHLTHSVYLELIDESRMRFLVDLAGEYAAHYVVVRMEIEYLGEVTLADTYLDISHDVTRVGKTSVLLSERAAIDDRTVVHSETTIVLWDASTRTPKAAPEELRDAVGGAG
jgi:acyl-CoA thioester hydrolase